MTSSPPSMTNASARGRWAAALLLAAVTLLAACGGQSSGTAGNGPQPGQNGSGDSSFAMSGAYQGSVTYLGVPYTSDFLSFLTPYGDWYGLYFLTTTSASVYPDIYTGKVFANSASSATIASLKASQFGKPVTTGSAEISGSSALNYKVSLTGINLANSQAASFSPNYIPTFTGINGVWEGGLRDSQNTADPTMNLSFSEDGTSTSSYAHCPLTIKLTQASGSAHAYFTARVEIPLTSFCPRTPITSALLEGIAFIHAAPPGSGKSRRLEIIAVDKTGSGISFRGDQ